MLRDASMVRFGTLLCGRGCCRSRSRGRRIGGSFRCNCVRSRSGGIRSGSFRCGRGRSRGFRSSRGRSRRIGSRCSRFACNSRLVSRDGCLRSRSKYEVGDHGKHDHQCANQEAGVRTLTARDRFGGEIAIVCWRKPRIDCGVGKRRNRIDRIDGAISAFVALFVFSNWSGHGKTSVT